MKQKRKTNLFRFVTLRAPQLISSERRALGFVEHPDPSGSHFLNAISGYTDIAIARTTLSTQIGSFTPYSNVDDVKAASTALWDFSLWLLKNKNNLVRSELDALIPALPTASKINKLWDNLFYDILTKKNGPIRQGCLQMIVAINFINKYVSYSPGVSTDDDVIAEEARLLKRLANGKVIVDKAFTIEKAATLSAPLGITSKSYVRHEAIHKGLMAGLNIAPLEAIRKEFCDLSKSYKADRKTAYDSQYSQYKTTTDATVDQYIQANNLQGQSNIEDLIPEDLTDNFVFSFDHIFSSSYTNGKLSTDALDYLSNHCLEDKTVEDVFARIDKEIGDYKYLKVQSKSRKQRDILINGVLAKTGTGNTKNFSITVKEISGGQQNSHDVYITLETDYNGGFFKSPDFKISISGTDYSHTDLDILSNDEGVIFAKISFGTLASIAKNVEFVFSGTFDLSNGKSMSLSKSGIGGVALLSGSGLFVQNGGTSAELYGVNRIGVADFRRVEQELCCYVAGEVSHIENILAKEYKEKSTRQLTRTERSIESKSERETEELTDTTSTTRHEMSSEIAEVLNRDRSTNFGFSVGVDGKYSERLKWNTNGYADFAFGHSTSNSNSEARNYAEDVTNRALERIVQKSSLTRKSKILREFEENNSHGFDNREGANHVTGVYRWIDKVYKNRIVNYGKRLMYEFMVPEPAKFYKESMVIQAEEEDVPAGSDNSGNAPIVTKPIHPKEHGIIDATSITREEYAAQCALYGVSPIAPFPEKKTISVDFAEATGSDDKHYAYKYLDNQIFVPELYRCTKLSGHISGSYRSRTKPRAYIKVNAGTPLYELTDLRKADTFSEAIDEKSVDLTGAITVAVNTLKMLSFSLTVVAECTLDPREHEQWQQDTYDLIIRAYEDQLQAFNDAQTFEEEKDAIENSNEEEVSKSNSGFNSQIMTTELKRLCIEMITSPFGIDQGKDFYQNGECDIPSLNLTGELDVYASRVKFLEQAFDWDIMSSLFYPYYWAKRCDWKALFQSGDGNDHVFHAFLQSGMGRVIVPVREGFEDAVTYFMETGDIWNGIGLAIDSDDELFLSLVDETTNIEGVVEGEEWETVVPSSLTIVQARSVLLDEEGLPCCETDADVLAELNLQADTNTLTLKTDPPA